MRVSETPAELQERLDGVHEGIHAACVVCGARNPRELLVRFHCSCSKEMCKVLATDEDGHFDAFDKQVDNIKRFGPSYLALQSFEAKAE